MILGEYQQFSMGCRGVQGDLGETLGVSGVLQVVSRMFQEVSCAFQRFSISFRGVTGLCLGCFFRF